MSDSTVYVVILRLPEFDFTPIALGVFTTFEKALELKEKYENEVGGPIRPLIYEVPLNGVATSGKLKYWSISMTPNGIKEEKKEIDLDEIWRKQKTIQLTPELKRKFEEVSKAKNLKEAKKKFGELLKSVDPEKWKEWKEKHKELKGR